MTLTRAASKNANMVEGYMPETMLECVGDGWFAPLPCSYFSTLCNKPKRHSLPWAAKELRWGYVVIDVAPPLSLTKFLNSNLVS